MTAALESNSPRIGPLRYGVRIAARVLATVWLGFWLWFVIAVSVSTGPPPAMHFAALLSGLVLPPLCAWWKPRLGGALFILVGALAAAYFAGWAAITMLALPAMLIGVVLLASG